jgi:hypothetical protein
LIPIGIAIYGFVVSLGGRALSGTALLGED